MTRNLAWALMGSLALAAAGTASADIMTIDPSSFASGQYVSYATPGVTLSTMTLVPVGTVSPLETIYGPNLGPVFASGDNFSSSTSNLWGFGGYLLYSMPDCLHGCSAFPSPYNNGQWLRVDFNSPVNYVSALQSEHDVNTASEIVAFDSSGDVVGTCLGWAGPTAPSCSSIASSSGNAYWLNESIFSSSDDISTILIGDRDPNVLANEVGAIRYGTVPEPMTFGLMALGLLSLAWARRRRLRDA